jgi:hypothetical protein
MVDLMNFPFVVFLVSLLVLWLSSRLGVFLRERQRSLDDASREDFGVVLAATLTLLGLIIGFTFSMAISRYDQRKNYEEGEANAIGTEYVRADLLPAADGAKVKSLLTSYVDHRIAYYRTREITELRQVNAETNQLEAQMWAAVQGPAKAQPTPVVALAVAGMNDVLNSQGYTQAAWWNRIPIAAWGLLFAIAICANLMVGFGIRRGKNEAALLLVLPLLISISFLLIADIDSPRGGIIRVRPQNLVSLSQSLHQPNQ